MNDKGFDNHALQGRLISIAEAAALIGMRRTSFWRFRQRHDIANVEGRKIPVRAVLRAIEFDERGESET